MMIGKKKITANKCSKQFVKINFIEIKDKDSELNFEKAYRKFILHSSIQIMCSLHKLTQEKAQFLRNTFGSATSNLDVS